MTAILVTGATGTVGSAVVRHLLGRGEQVIAGVHDRAARAEVPEAAQVRAFTFGAAPAELEEAFEGVDRLFLMRPPAIADVRSMLFPVIDAAQRTGIRQIAFLSLQGVQMNRKTPHHAVEEYLRQIRAPYTFLRPNFFMQNLSTTYAEPIRTRGEIFVPAGRARIAFIDARDVGRVAAAVLSEPGHLRKAYTLSGERSMTYWQVAQVMTEVLGRPIQYDRPSEDDYLSRLVTDGASEDYIAVQKMIHKVVRLNLSALPNRAVRKISGQPATPLRQFVSDFRTVWQ
ncbi:SDR family oxidoreductase [Arthrobacter flavus]|uniref:SDR family oxidoreductase n=1 Tax=Arthrobacter flavus TaxID=95172 RepID=A0ABW4Q3F6_9MICC